MQPTFRVAAAGDAGALLAMMRELNEHEGMAFDEPRARAALAELIADERFGVAHLILFGGETAGYLVVTFGFSVEFGGRDAFVDELFVKDEFRGRGAGKAALRLAAEVCRARGVGALHLEVGRANEPAQALYRREGFLDHDRYLLTKWL
ncbi:MAG: GNAT family N-acetyltransferase [Acidobacteria bacterium]|nr:GNAT family N-acetyltransferase [Acidobacteriota bacterium]